MARLNWEELKREFILGDYKSLTDFAKKKGLKRNGNFNKKTKGWAEEKATKEQQKSKEVVKGTLERQIQNEIDRNTAHLIAWDALLDIVMEMVTDKDKHLSTKAGARNVYALEKLSAVLDRIQKGQRLAEGMDQEKPQQVNVDLFVQALNATASEVWDDEEE
jgi:hypothetical protein